MNTQFWIQAVLIITITSLSTSTSRQPEKFPLAKEYTAKAPAYSRFSISNHPGSPKIPQQSLRRQVYRRPQHSPAPEDESEDTAKDRIYIEPYKLPFWGQPYGVNNKGGPPYDGIFVGRKGPGQFQGYPKTPTMGQGSSSRSARGSDGSNGAARLYTHGAQVGGGYAHPPPPLASNNYYSYPPPLRRKKIKVIKKWKSTTTPEPEEEECECSYDGQDCDCENYTPPPPKYRKVYKKSPCKYGYMPWSMWGCRKPPPTTTTTEAPYEEETEEDEEYDHTNPNRRHDPARHSYPQMVPQYVPMYFGGIPGYPHNYPVYPYYAHPQSSIPALPPETFSSTTTTPPTTTTTSKYETSISHPQNSRAETPGPPPHSQYPIAGVPEHFQYPFPGHMYPYHYPTVGYSPYHQYYYPHYPGPPYPYHFQSPVPPPQYPFAGPQPQYPTAG